MMEIKDIIEVLAYIFAVMFGAMSAYYKTNAKLQEKVKDFIRDAEYEYEDCVDTNGDKHDFVVYKLYSLVPAPLKLVITTDVIETLVDNAFSSIKNYARIEADKAVDKVTKALDKK